MKQFFETCRDNEFVLNICVYFTLRLKSSRTEWPIDLDTLMNSSEL